MITSMLVMPGRRSHWLWAWLTTRDLSHQTEHVIPIIGDATLTCGMALETLNNIPAILAVSSSS